MSSIVIDLQNEILSQGCDIVIILRRAHVIAFKLGLEELDQWISNELNGYPNQDACPQYRTIRGDIRAFDPYRGWIPVVIPDGELERAVCEKKLPNSISEITALCNTDENVLVHRFTGNQHDILNNLSDFSFPMEYALHIPKSNVMDIIEKVKNTILEWTLRLEKEGVIGEGMSFNAEEKQTAKSLPQTINNYYGATNVIKATGEKMQIISSNENVSFSYNEACSAVSEIEDAISRSQLKIEDKEQALQILSEIKEKIVQEKKPSVIKALLVGLKDLLIGAGGNVVAGLIQATIQRLF